MTSPGIYGVLVLGADSSAIIDSCVFENIQTYGSGTLFAIIFNHNYLIKIINNTIINCKCTSYFIMQEESSNVTVWNNSFINNTGNMFDISRGDVDLKFNLVQNIVCHYQSGCLFNLRKSSNMFASNNKFINISNSNEGGAFYFENSNFKSDDLILINSGSDSYAGCLLGVNSHFQIKNFQAYEFKKGCIQFINSSIQIQDSIFQADYFKEPKDFSECYSSLCILECFHFKMNNTLFIGNYDNSYDGGVFF